MSIFGSQQHSTTSTSSPWQGQQPYLKQQFQQAQNWLNSGGAQYYPGQQVASFTPAQQQGFGSLTNFANGGAQQLANNAANTENYLTTTALNPTNNPNFQAAANAAVSPIYQTLNRKTLPELDSQAIKDGAYGGARNAIADTNAVNDANIQAGNVTSQMANSAYQNGLNAATRGLALAPQTQQMGAVPGQTLLGVGQAQQTQNQNLINAAMNKYAYNAQLPLTTAQQYAGLIQGNYGGTQTKPYFTNKGAGALGGALGGAQLGSMVGGPYGAAIGGGLGGLLGLMG